MEIGNQSCGSENDVLVDKNEPASPHSGPTVNKRHENFVLTLMESKMNHETWQLLQDLSWCEYQKEEPNGLQAINRYSRRDGKMQQQQQHIK